MIRNGFIAAGLMNIVAVLIFSKFFTNSVIPESDPVVMSYFGLLMIMIWGLAYIGLATTFTYSKWIVGVFVIEKLIYVITWLLFIFNNEVSAIYQKDVFAGIFYSVYGINDFIFFLFFLYVFFKLRRNSI